MKTRICTKCKEEKEITEFWKQKEGKYGVKSICKKCSSLLRKEYSQKNREKLNQYGRDYNKKFPIKRWCQNTLAQHKRRGFKVLLNFRELLPIARVTQYCPICECKLSWKYGTELNDNTPSLDRMGNEKILTLDNVQIICKRCNTTKYNRTMKEFIKYCESVIKKLGKSIIIPNNVKIIGNAEDTEYQTTDPIVVKLGREWDNILRKEK